jgi:predicted permease
MALYRVLLLLYPAAFRGQYGEELENVFRTRLRHSRGLVARLLLWFETAIDIILTAIQTHWDILWQDIRYTLRTLRRSPGFAATAIAVAALGIGATTAAYTLTDHILLRPLPYADQDRLVMLWEDMSPGVYKEMEPSPANYRDWKQMSKSFSAMTAWRGLSVAMTGVGDPEQIEGACVTSDLFPMLGVQAMLGRTFSAEDDRAGAPGTVVLSYGTWQARFAADPRILRRKLLFDGVPYTVIGVVPRSFNYPRREVELWTAMRFENRDFEDRNDNYLQVVAKLRPEVSREQALAEMRIISQELKREYPKDNEHVGVGIVPLHEQYSERSRLMLLALLGAGLCVLLIACTNLANLLLARALTRRKEVAVRNALGAGRDRLVRQMVTESLLLSLCGGFLGILLANASVPLLAKLVPDLLSLRAVTIDGRVLLFALALTVITGICFGIIPAAQSARGITASSLAEGNRGGVGGRKERLRAALVIAEVSISFVLLIACGLLIRALWHLQQTDPGFRAENVLTTETVLQMPRYEKAARRLSFFEHVLPEIRKIPGVVNAAYISFLPMLMRGGIFPITTAGHDPNIDRAFHNASIRFVTPGYFETMGIPLLRGRAIVESDSDKTTAVAVVSGSFAREYWPGQDPIGRHFAFSFLGGTYDRTVAGVVGDVRVRGLEGRSEPQVYLSYRQQPDGFMVWYAPKDLAIRSNMKTGQLLPLVRRIISEIDAQQPISNVQTLSEIVADDSAARSVQVRVLVGFALIAIMLAGIGIHGLLSFAVGNRSQEIGVRMALGASPRHIFAMVLRESAILSICGTLAGIVLAYGASHAIAALLAGVSPNDPHAYAIAITIVLCMTLAGSLLPGVRALRVDPLTAIRAE